MHSAVQFSLTQNKREHTNLYDCLVQVLLVAESVDRGDEATDAEADSGGAGSLTNGTPFLLAKF